ncbi:hypothetical protein Dd703_1043 [Musicola paradisiaca Ech703]|uniref:Uncharacterized protein n=1 Tax=Musicola paradisiaca (strain Ech703) TaxID=579405 RepID=C6CBR3_MUSP7|nr:hypothetical protein Dd703_1043 [Musicola paradisiaca Ech703]
MVMKPMCKASCVAFSVIPNLGSWRDERLFLYHYCGGSLFIPITDFLGVEISSNESFLIRNHF